MPVRTRRVRLLAVGVCIAIVLFLNLFQRNGHQVDRNVDEFTSNTNVGGGAVLRPDEQEKQTPLYRPPPPPPQPVKGSRPEPEPEPEPEPKQELGFMRTTTAKTTTTAAAKNLNEPVATTSNAVANDATRIAAATSTSLANVKPPQLLVDELPFQVPPARLDNEDYLALAAAAISSLPAIHWSKFPESYPITSTIQLPTSKPSAIPRIQKKGSPGADKDRLSRVKEACQWAWKGFRENGWEYDEVKPLSGGGQNSFNGWGATLVDSLDTLWIMGLTEEFEEAVNKTAEIDFTTSSRGDIPLFEVTIRYLGGMIAAYDISGRKYKVLLAKAVELADILYSAFDTPNRIPETYYHWKPAYAENKHRASTRAVMAELGTLSLEFTRLAQLTGEPKYYDAIARVTDAFEEWQPRTRLPGMWPLDMDASGCRRPVTKKKPSTLHHVPVISGDQAKVDLQLKADIIAALQKTSLESPSRNSIEKVLKTGGSGTKASGTDYGTQKPASQDPEDGTPKLGSVANPAAANMLHAEPDSSMRLSMEDFSADREPGIGKIKNYDVVHNNAKAKGPLPPKGESSVQNGDPKAIPYGQKLHEPLPPQAGTPEGKPLNTKRQLDELSAWSATGDTATTSGNRTQLRHEEVRQAATFDEDEEEPDCIPQGFESVSAWAPESFSLGGRSDSTYEYLPKMHLLIGGRFDQYKNMYLGSMKPIVEKLLFRPMTKDDADILVSGEVVVSVNYTTGGFKEELLPKGEHLTCFVGGMVAMGGKIFDIPEHVELGRKLTDGCVWAYMATASGIMPESFQMQPCDSRKTCKWNQTAYYEALDPQFEFRDQQRKDFAEQYQIADLEAFEKELAAVSASAAAAAAATKTATPSHSLADGDNKAYSLNNPIPNKSKRQSFDTAPKGAAAPSLPQPGLTPSLEISTTGDADPEDSSRYGSAYYDDTDEYPPSKPLYTPAPPPSHEQYVADKITHQRLPSGFTSIDGRAYILRPEAIESVFYMYRITGDQYWRDVGWKMFTAIDTATRAPYGHASINDITSSQPKQHDKMESFWIAETLKYFYLLFDEPDRWSLDDWVLNTEAHFFKRPENPAK